MKYITSMEMANRIGKSKRWVTECCRKGMIEGARMEGSRWMIPEDAKWEVGSETKTPLPIGVSNFELAISDYYYVDKTLLIKDLIDYRPQVSLFLRPRRFGKTLNMDMLKTFFEKNEQDKSELFVGTNIWKQDKKYRNEQGKYPVIYFTFKDVKYATWEETFINLKSLIQNEYKRHIDILECGFLHEADIAFYKEVMSGTLENALWPSTLGRLTEMLHTASGVTAMILIDEYDTPIHQGHINGYYDEIISFMRNFLSGGLKDNAHLAMAFLTGILRVAKESIFSGLNNLNTNSVLDERYSEYFGFTESEVKKILKDYGYREKLADVKKWYDGYRFGKTEIYNPWSVLNYVDSECKSIAYWQSTGSNDIIGEILNSGGNSVGEEIRSLLLGETKKAYIDTSVIYPEIQKNPSSIYSFLLMSGYLTTNDAELLFDGNTMCELKIPNKEIQIVYEKEIINRAGSLVSQETSINLQAALLSDDEEMLQKLLEKYLKETISYHDAAAEGFYHGLVLGLTAMLYNYYEILSNREAGNGRFDIRLKSKDSSKPHFVIEIKSITDEIDSKKVDDILAKEADDALKQINDKEYITGLTGKVRKIGVAFWKKNCAVKTEIS
ncbi:MAG: hypothetical protein E7309_04175 [Butyrivibrio sp.]|nr:hypothetical protein [Butyrivibrio sp.]